MPYFLGMLLALGALYLFLSAFARADAGDLSRALKTLLIGVLSAAAIVSAVLERPGFGLIFATLAGILIWRQRRKSRLIVQRKAPAMRSPWLELRLGANAAQTDGTVLAGEFEGCLLSALSEGQLGTLHEKLSQDGESKALLETYLDGRAPGWRQSADPHIDSGQRGAPGAGAMADEEAYQILGLQPGAGAADIRKAHRRLSQRVRGDGSAALVRDRIDEACRVLLARHH
jgi:hypothetical protein